MKFVVYAIAMFCTVAGFSQQGGVDYDYFSHNGSILVYNKERDSIFLSKMNGDSILPRPCMCHPDNLMRLGSGVASQIFKEIQIDGQGAKEIVIKRTSSEMIFGHGDSYDTLVNEIVSVYEIWNLDSKELLFRSVPYYENKYNCFCADSPPDRKTAKGERSYSYDIAFDDKGTVTISNLNLKGGDDDLPFTADHQEGVYTFKNGKYSKQ